MGIQTIGSQGAGQESHLQPLARQSSWHNLTLDEVGNQLRNLGKSLGSMNLDELLNSVWMAEAEANQSTAMDVEKASLAYSPQRQASLTLARALSGKTVDEVWTDIQQGQKKRFGEEMKGEREPTLREMTLEDFLVKAGIFAKASFGPVMELDAVDGEAPQNFSQQMGLSPSPSIGTLSDTPTSGRKRDSAYPLERTVERRLRRKIKNRESAARSRARKQAYHNELVSKVSHLEEENTMLKKEKELEKMLARELPSKPKYHLRRTSSASF